MLTLIISAYFAAMLMVAGIAKLDDAASFKMILRATRLVPARWIDLVARVVPLFEIAFAVVLLSGFWPVAMAFANWILFTGFLVTKVILSSHLIHPMECGCFGSAYRTKIDLASLTVSILLIALAALYWWLVAVAEPVNVTLRAIVLGPSLAVVGLMYWRVLQRRHAFQSSR